MGVHLQILRITNIKFALWQSSIIDTVIVIIHDKTGPRPVFFLRCRTFQTNNVVTKKNQWSKLFSEILLATATVRLPGLILIRELLSHFFILNLVVIYFVHDILGKIKHFKITWSLDQALIFFSFFLTNDFSRHL